MILRWGGRLLGRILPGGLLLRVTLVLGLGLRIALGLRRILPLPLGLVRRQRQLLGGLHHHLRGLRIHTGLAALRIPGILLLHGLSCAHRLGAQR